ncbi:uncharacterized protein LOC114520158 [Dendronephthya gigantea]|uniref:uncharacterized protein LOC114520158 n=1 Tax=Dendronephthya gigantea TaxID=151771 RepID=UPI00106CA5E2|nr:uncharacterized protein LOC114520158 [Dendronephthya gigantea]
MATLLTICALFFSSELTQLSECLTESAVFRIHAKKYLANHVIDTKQAESEFECGLHCVRKESCASVNYKISGIGKGRCELNNDAIQETSNGDEETNPEFNHLVIEIEKRRKSIETQLQEPVQSEEYRRLSSCKDVLKKNRKAINGVYTLNSIATNQSYDVYCHMANITACGGGGWTLVMKMNGENDTFIYNSPLWTNKETHAIQDGLEGLTEKESKLASYWKTPFTKVCLGMSYNGNRKWMTFDYTANSLYSAIADGTFRATTAGWAAWKSLVRDSSLQRNCNREGFNVISKIRIGLFANQEKDCNSCDSRIGYGIWINRKTCGNYAHPNWDPDNGGKDFVTFGYILVQ